MAKSGGFGICNQPVREKLQYEELMTFKRLTMEVGDEMFHFEEDTDKVLAQKVDIESGCESPLLGDSAQRQADY